MKTFKIGLLPKIIIAIAAGIGLGLVFPEWTVRIFDTFNGIFSQFLGFMIPLIIVGLVTPAIAKIGNKAGKMLIATVVIAYGSTLIAGFTSYLVGDATFHGMIDSSSQTEIASEGAKAITPFFNVPIPPLMEIMTALVLSFAIGLGIAKFRNRTLESAAEGLEEIITWLIKSCIIPVLPIYIFGIFLKMAYEGEVYSVMSVFIKIIGVIFLIHIGILLLQYIVAGAIAKKNPFKMLWTMLPAYVTALGTQSSAATIPVTLEQARKNGVSDNVSGFVIPLCATIHLAGSTLKIVACALALMIYKDMPYDFGTFAGFICMLGITMVAAPGVPGGAIMAALGVLASMLGFSENDCGLMIALYIAMDSFGTACNVTGDGAIAVIIDKWFKK